MTITALSNLYLLLFTIIWTIRCFGIDPKVTKRETIYWVINFLLSDMFIWEMGILYGIPS